MSAHTPGALRAAGEIIELASVGLDDRAKREYVQFIKPHIAAVIDREAGVKELVETLEGIANAKPSEWDEIVRDQFKEWAQSRARFALAKHKGEHA